MPSFPLNRIALLALLCITSALLADIPRLISYQGVLTDEVGAPVQDGEYPMTFQLFDTAAGGTHLWFENRPVTTVNGVFDILLGEVNPLNLAFDRSYYLQTVFEGNVLSPRTLLTASAYSLNIADDVAVRSINGMQDEVFLTGEGGVVVTQIDDTLRLSAPSINISGDVSGATTDLTAEWTSYNNLVAVIAASGPGLIFCESAVQLQVSHTNGTGDRIQLCHSSTLNSAGPNVAYYSVHSVPAEFPTFLNNEVTVPVRTVFEVTEAGEYSIFLNGRVTQGQGGDRFWYASLTATYFPEHAVSGRPSLDGLPPHIEKPSR